MGSVMRMEKFIGRLHLRLLSADFGEFFWAARIAEKDLFTEKIFFLKEEEWVGGSLGKIDDSTSRNVSGTVRAS